MNNNQREESIQNLLHDEYGGLAYMEKYEAIADYEEAERRIRAFAESERQRVYDEVIEMVNKDLQDAMDYSRKYPEDTIGWIGVKFLHSYIQQLINKGNEQ
jgi:hypothetical protein